MSQVTHEQFKGNQCKPLKLRAIKEGKIWDGTDHGKQYKKGDILEAKFINSMVFFLNGGETINFYDFELV